MGKYREFHRESSSPPALENKELSSSVFGGKQVYSFWQTIFASGVSKTGEHVMANPIDIQAMIAPHIDNE